MSGTRGLRQRARDRAGALARGTARGTFPIQVAPRACVRCRTTTSRVTNHAYREYRGGGALRCGCGGRLVPAHDRRLVEILTSAAEVRLTELLNLAANTIHPDERAGLDLIRNRTGGTPLAGGTAAHDDELGSQTS